LTITLAGAGGTLSGTGLSGGTSGVYTLTGSAATVTSELDALSFKPNAGASGASSTTTFTLSDQSSAYGTPAVDSTTSVIDRDPAVSPTIAGTVGGQTTTWEAPVTPFAHVTIGDGNLGATDALTITLGGAGGTLGGTGLSGGAGGAYTLSGTASAITSELDALVFTPTAGALNTSSTTTFTLSDLSSAYAAPAVDSTTSVINRDSAAVVAKPGSGLVFDNTFSPACTAAYENCIVAAEKQLESLFTNSDTIVVAFDEQNQGNNGAALSNSYWGNTYSYSALKSALQAAAPTDVLPATDPDPAGGAD
jgi:hypothetical protein